MKTNQGFTLMEMITVVLIVSILAAVAVPQYRRAIQKAQATEAVAMLRTIHESGERLAAQFGYRSFQNFVGDARATFKRMDMFDENTIACSFNNTYTEMTCEHFKYLLNKNGTYTIAQKLTAPYAGTEIRLTRSDLPVLSCTGNEDACDVYNIDYVGE